MRLKITNAPEQAERLAKMFLSNGTAFNYRCEAGGDVFEVVDLSPAALDTLLDNYSSEYEETLQYETVPFESDPNRNPTFPT